MMFTGVLSVAGGFTVLDPQAPGTKSVLDLAGVTMVVCTIIFLIVTGIIVYSLMRYRWREGEPDPHQFAGSKKVELIWTAIPFFIVIFLFILTARTMSSSDPAPLAEPDLIVTGHQWWWEAQYPVYVGKEGERKIDDANSVITANEIHIPVGKPFSVELRASDVLHEFWVAELTRKMTTVPGKPNHIWIQADKEGTYLGVCSEFCGTQHAWMRFTVVAESPEKYEAWRQNQLKKAPAPVTESEKKGLALFEEMSCVSCHAINGTTATARVGPDLTHFASRKEFGAGIAKNDPENLHRWFKNPQDVKPGVKMPNFNLTDEQVTDMVSYFETLK